MPEPARKSASAKRLRSVRMSDEQLFELLDELDVRENCSGNRHDAPHYRYRRTALQIDVHEQSHSLARPYLVASRWISRHQLSFLHGSYLYPETEVRVRPVTLHGNWRDMQGAVETCRYIGLGVHEVTMRFSTPLDPAMFSPDAVRFRVLIVERDRLTADLLSNWVRRLNVMVDGTTGLDQAVELLADAQFDLILCGLDTCESAPVELCTALRQRGHTGWLVAMSTRADAASIREHSIAGFNETLAIPFDKAKIEELLRALREEPVHSALADDPAIAPLLPDFVKTVQACAQALRVALMDREREKLLELLRNLHTQSCAFGFDPIAQVAESALNELKLRPQVTPSAAEHIESLIKLCFLVRAPQLEEDPPEPATAAPRALPVPAVDVNE